MKRYYPLLSRQLFNRKYRKLAQVNLTKIFSKFTSARKHLNRIKTEFKSTYRDKIKAEYHHPVKKSPAAKRSSPATKPMATTTMEEAIDLSPKRQCNQIPQSFLTPPDEHRRKPTNDDDHHHHHHTGKSFEIIQMSAGRYLNFSIAKTIAEMTVDFCTGHPVELTVAIYVKKSKINGLEKPTYLFVLGRLTQTAAAYQEPKTFTIGIYHGAFASHQIGNEILEPFVRQMEAVQMCMPHSDRRLILKGIVTDPLAASLITCTALPNSLFGCAKCRQPGKLQFNHSHTSFPQSCAPEHRRRDQDFRSVPTTTTNASYHLSEPILLRLHIGLVSQVIIDYKHIVCLGVVRHLMELWRSGRIDYRLNATQQASISTELLDIATTTYCELNSRPKSLDQLADWTADDWQQFLLYHGPVVLENKLSPKYYINFLCLHLATRIMCNRNAQREYSAFIVGFLMKRFVGEFAELYGADLITHDIHMLLHFEEVMQCYGSVGDVCGFNYNDELARIEKCIEANVDLLEIGDRLNAAHDGQQQQQQQHRRPHNLRGGRAGDNFQILSSEDSMMHMKSFQLNMGAQDGYVITKKGIVRLCRVERIPNGTVVLVGQRYRQTYILYQAPLTDEKLWLVAEPDEPEMFLLSDVVAKGMRYDTARGICIMPIVCF